jgi:hypothetical protein
MGLGDILDGAFKLYKANAKVLIAITAVFVVPVQLLSAFFQRNMLNGEGFLTLLNDPSLAEDSSQTFGSDLSWVIGLVATVLVMPFVAGAVSRVVAASYLGDELSAGPALRATGRRWWALIAAWVMVHVIETVGFVLCILPGLLVMALFMAVAPAIVVEELGAIRGMKRSARLLKPRIWPVLGIALVSGLLASILGSVLGFVPQMAALLVGLRWGWLLLAAGGILTAVVTTPFVAIVATLVYFDGRIRHEGLDLAVMAAEITRRENPR